jgi:hypothetical protein
VASLLFLLKLQCTSACHTGSPNCYAGTYCEQAVCVACQIGRAKSYTTSSGPNTCNNCTAGIMHLPLEPPFVVHVLVDSTTL